MSLNRDCTVLCTVLGNLLYTVADVCFDINYSLLDHSNVPLCMSLQMRTLKQDICFRVNTNVLFVDFWTSKETNEPRNPTIFNIIRWFGGSQGRMTNLMFQVLFVFHNFLQNSLQKSFQFIFYFLINLQK